MGSYKLKFENGRCCTVEADSKPELISKIKEAEDRFSCACKEVGGNFIDATPAKSKRKPSTKSKEVIDAEKGLKKAKSSKISSYIDEASKKLDEAYSKDNEKFAKGNIIGSPVFEVGKKISKPFYHEGGTAIFKEKEYRIINKFADNWWAGFPIYEKSTKSQAKAKADKFYNFMKDVQTLEEYEQKFEEYMVEYRKTLFKNGGKSDSVPRWWNKQVRPYMFFVFNTETNKVWAGNEYQEDAKDELKEFLESNPNLPLKVFTKRAITNKKINPLAYENWARSTEQLDAIRKFADGGGVDDEKYCRLANDTGKGINEGYVIGDGDMYFKTEKGLVDYLRENYLPKSKLTDKQLLKKAYDDEYYYYTEWEGESEIEDQGYYYTEDGKEIEIASKGKKLALGGSMVVANAVSNRLPATTSAIDRRMAERIYSERPSRWEDRGLKYKTGGKIGIKKQGSLDENDHLSFEFNVHQINPSFYHLLIGTIEKEDTEYYATYDNDLYENDSQRYEKTFSTYKQAENWILSKINADKEWYIKNFPPKLAKGGGVREHNGREYSFGRAWTNDHNHQNKKQNYEVPLNSRKSKFATGGTVGQEITFKHWSGDVRTGSITEDLGNGNFEVSSGFGSVLVNKNDIIKAS